MKLLYATIISVLIITVSTVETEAYKPYPEALELQTRVIEQGDTLWSLYEEYWIAVARLNRLSPDAVQAGIEIVEPIHLNKAEDFSPLPARITKLEGEEKAVYIDLEFQALGMYENGVIIKWGDWMPISSGKDGYKTPKGEFRIREKKDFHVSSSRPEPTGGAVMPFALHLTGPYWIHAGSLPGSPDSYGCVRIMQIDAVKLFNWVEVGTRVVIE